MCWGVAFHLDIHFAVQDHLSQTVIVYKDLAQCNTEVIGYQTPRLEHHYYIISESSASANYY